MNFISFRISGENIDFNQVNKNITISPKKIGKKGEIRCNKVTKETFAYSEDFWVVDIEIENDDETEAKIAEYVDLLFQSKSFIRQLASVHNVTLWITINQEKFQHSLLFPKTVLVKISEMGIEMGIVCMQWGRGLREEDV